ncbi:hypothetical protein NDU88_001071, partial [Pleurodeles waltl]
SHPRHQINSIPYGEMVRARRNCSLETDFLQCVGDMEARFKSRGYSPLIIDKARDRAMRLKRTDTLKHKARSRDASIRCIVNYTRTAALLQKCMNKHWHVLTADPYLKGIISDTSVLTYCRGRTLKNILCPSYRAAHQQENWLTSCNKGFYKCGHCGMCRLSKSGISTFKSLAGDQFRINYNITCDSKFIIYMITCKCGLYYVGSTIRSLRIRVSEHYRALRQDDDRYPIVTHMRQCTRQSQTKGFEFFGFDH